jgi:hypothetical protein
MPRLRNHRATRSGRVIPTTVEAIVGVVDWSGSRPVLHSLRTNPCDSAAARSSVSWREMLPFSDTSPRRSTTIAIAEPACHTPDHPRERST